MPDQVAPKTVEPSFDLKSVDAIPPHWLEWVARNLLRGVETEIILDKLASQGMDRLVASQVIERTKLEPIFSAAQTIAKRLDKLELLLDVQVELLAQRKDNFEIERRTGLSKEDFHKEFYCANKPVVLTDLMHNWKALSNWSPQFFKTVCGSQEIEVQCDRRSYPINEVYKEGHSKTLLLADYVDLISEIETNEYYLTANDGFFERPDVQFLLNDIEIFPQYLEPNDTYRKMFFWFGPKGTISPLHRDRLNVFMAQVYGRKLIRFVSPLQTHRVYNERSFYSEIDSLNPDLVKYPLLSKVRFIDVILEPGEVLFIPVGWWHCVKALEMSINVSFTNFVFPNSFEALF